MSLKDITMHKWTMLLSEDTGYEMKISVHGLGYLPMSLVR